MKVLCAVLLCAVLVGAARLLAVAIATTLGTAVLVGAILFSICVALVYA